MHPNTISPYMYENSSIMSTTRVFFHAGFLPISRLKRSKTSLKSISGAGWA